MRESIRKPVFVSGRHASAPSPTPTPRQRQDHWVPGKEPERRLIHNRFTTVYGLSKRQPGSKQVPGEHATDEAAQVPPGSVCQTV